MHLGPSLNTVCEPAWSAGALQSAGLDADEAQAKGIRFEQCARRLLQNHSPQTPAVVIFVPGRVELLGKHTDYCGGCSLLCTVQRGMCFVATARDDDEVSFHSIDLNASELLRISSDFAPRAGHWSDYIGNVLRRVARNFPGAHRGANIAMSSDLPMASGLSSSSALIVGTFMAMKELNGLAKHAAYKEQLATNQALAGYLGTIENGQSFGKLAGDKGVGTFGGSQDHTAIFCCRAETLSVYDFCPVRHRQDVTLPHGMLFVIAQSGLTAEKTGAAMAAYNNTSRRASRLVEEWNRATQSTATCLNDIVKGGEQSLAELRRIAVHIDASGDLLARLDQFVNETAVIIPQSARAIENGDWTTLGRLVDYSQQLAETCLRNQTPETIALRHKLRECGALAASSFGAGFGGSVWGLFDERTLADWRAAAGITSIDYFVTRPGCGATILR